MKNLITIQGLKKNEIQQILDQAHTYKKRGLSQFAGDDLKGHVIAKLFFEPSTRTRNSFEIAAYRLGAFVIKPDMKDSALTKGETFVDTLKTFRAMGVSACVIRTSEEHLLDKTNIDNLAIINAGDGTQNHPTQALLDLMTISEHKKAWKDLTVSFIGDVKYSRVARSLIQGLHIMGVENIHIIAPAELLPEKPFAPNIKIFDSLDEGLVNSDVVVCLRLQKERMSAQQKLNIDTFKQNYCLTEEKLCLAKKDAIVMHPGPMNRDIEIASNVADGPQSVILQQVENSVAIRMSILKWCLD